MLKTRDSEGNESHLAVSGKVLGWATAVLAFGITVATVTSTLLTRDTTYASKQDVQAVRAHADSADDAFRRTDSVVLYGIGELKTIVTSNATELQIVTQRQNMVLCRLFQDKTGRCEEMLNSDAFRRPGAFPPLPKP